MSRPDAALVTEVRLRAGGRCEYCRSPEAHAVIPFEVEHIISLKHRGETTAANLAFACFYCNRYKGPNVAGITEPGGAVVRLFHPRLDAWADHFAWDGPLLVPRSDVGAGDDCCAADQSAERDGCARSLDERRHVVAACADATRAISARTPSGV